MPREIGMASIHKQEGKPFWFCAYSTWDTERRQWRRHFKSTGTADRREASQICRAWDKAAHAGCKEMPAPKAERQIVTQEVSDVFPASNRGVPPDESVRQRRGSRLESKKAEVAPTSGASLNEVARAAGISNMAASLALRNRPGVSEATRRRVHQIAGRLGYVPDARIATWMAGIRAAKTKDLLPIVWLNNHAEKDAWRKYKFLSPYMEGARSRALQLGYRLEEIWSREPGVTGRHISRILYQRGIEGVIATPFVNHFFHFDWNHIACVCIGLFWVAPHFHRITPDYYFNLMLALKLLRRAGYRRIGICLDESIDHFGNHAIYAAAHRFHSTIPKSDRVPPLFLVTQKNDAEMQSIKKQMFAWMRRHKPDVIVGHDSRQVEWVEEAGYRVPDEVGIVHLATEDDVSDWAGICSNKRVMGACAVDLVVSLMRNHEFGLPKTAMETLICGSWHAGRTLLIPKAG